MLALMMRFNAVVAGCGARRIAPLLNLLNSEIFPRSIWQELDDEIDR